MIRSDHAYDVRDIDVHVVLVHRQRIHDRIDLVHVPGRFLLEAGRHELVVTVQDDRIHLFDLGLMTRIAHLYSFLVTTFHLFPGHSRLGRGRRRQQRSGQN